MVHYMAMVTSHWPHKGFFLCPWRYYIHTTVWFKRVPPGVCVCTYQGRWSVIVYFNSIHVPWYCCYTKRVQFERGWKKHTPPEWIDFQNVVQVLAAGSARCGRIWEQLGNQVKCTHTQPPPPPHTTLLDLELESRKVGKNLFSSLSTTDTEQTPPV